jgi:hypothetical protein
MYTVVSALLATKSGIIRLTRTRFSAMPAASDQQDPGCAATILLRINTEEPDQSKAPMGGQF